MHEGCHHTNEKECGSTYLRRLVGFSYVMMVTTTIIIILFIIEFFWYINRTVMSHVKVLKKIYTCVGGGGGGGVGDGRGETQTRMRGYDDCVHITPYGTSNTNTLDNKMWVQFSFLSG